MRPYGRSVLLLGDSMGGAGVLLACGLLPAGARALAFTPQTDVSKYEARTRLDMTETRCAQFTRDVLASVAASRGDVVVHYGLHCAEDCRQITKRRIVERASLALRCACR